MEWSQEGKMLGNIHSVETCGTVDGPGIRYVIFTQGCLLRCQFCHNADTWEIGTGNKMSVDEIMNDLEGIFLLSIIKWWYYR